MVGRVGRKAVFGLASKLGFQAKPGFVFPSPCDDIAGEKAYDRPDDQPEGKKVENERDDREDWLNVAEQIQNRTGKQEYQFGDEQRIVEVISTVPTVHEAGELVAKFVTHVS